MNSFVHDTRNDFLVPSPSRANTGKKPTVCPFLGFNDDDQSVPRARALTTNHHGSSTFMLTSFDGLIIRKDDIRTFQSKRDPNVSSGFQRFVIRTSVESWTAVTAWGSPAYLEEMTQNLHVGDLVLIRNARSKILPPSQDGKSSSGNDARSWLPFLPVDIVHDVNEKEGYIGILWRQDMRPHSITVLRAPPLLESGNVFPLSVLKANINSLIGKYVNLIGIVKEVGRLSSFTTTRGSRAHKIGLLVFDQLCPGLVVTLWGEENGFMASKFVPFHTVVLFSELIVSKDSFTGLPSLVSSAKTLITCHPAMPASVPLETFLTDLDTTLFLPAQPDLNAMDYFSCKAVREALQQPPAPTGLVFSGRLCAYLSFFDLDGPDNRIVVFRCSKCQVISPVQLESTCCNTYCPQYGADLPASFEIRCNFSDGSGTLSGVVLSGQAAESLLGMTALDFLNLTRTARATLKWRYLFEIADIGLMVVSREADKKKIIQLLELVFI